jgi:Na+-transporting NADH:ubiquinone oxidoreductase subunit C
VRQSNLYIIVYSAILTIVCGGLLALAYQGLKDKQQANIDLEQKQNILGSVLTLDENSNIEELYSKRVKAFVIDFQGNVKEGMLPKDVDVAAEYKKPADKRLLPVYEFRNENDPSQVENVVFPVYGYGLWNNIWGFVALKNDFNTIQGVKFKHAGETPGLGARIESEEIQDRFKGKTIYEASELVSVVMMKGEGNDYADESHKVDGMSGATLTGKGVNNMLLDYLKCYENYIKKNKKN